MTLVEVMMAIIIFAIMATGIAATLLQSRRLTEGSVAQANAQAAVESYMEQMENMLLTDLTCPTLADGVTVLKDAQGNPTFGAFGLIPTRTNNNSTPNDPLVWSNTGSGHPAIPNLASIIPGVTHTLTFPGVVDNLKEIPATPNNPGQPTTWAALWPSADNSAPAGAPGPTTPFPSTNNLHVDIWVWVTDLTQQNAAASSTNIYGNAQTVYGITIIYMWLYNSPAGKQYYIGSLHSIRSILS
jgi:type II secretory pathway pseudopilin PulG